MTPGDNLLMIAMGAIEPQLVQYKKCVGRVENAAGYFVSEFAPQVTVASSSVQAVPRAMYSQLGLDLQKRYVRWFVSAAIADVSRENSGDQIIYSGRIYAVESMTEWYGQDGWNEALCVCVG